MDVFIGNNMPVNLEDSDPGQRVPALKKRLHRDRRRKRRDRSKGNRDGMAVRLSGKIEARRAAMPSRRQLAY
jgi:hypothetical protein